MSVNLVYESQGSNLVKYKKNAEGFFAFLPPGDVLDPQD